MFGKSDLVDSLNRDLARARDKRDALTSGVATLTAQITELEARLSAENDRRERERAANEIERVKKQVKDRYVQFASAIAGLRDATEMAVAIVPETRELNEFLEVVAAEGNKAIDDLLSDLARRIEALRAGPELPQSLSGSPELPLNNDRVLRLPEWLPHSEPAKEEATEDRCSTAAA
jgi:chromosome segregation ATPase